MKTRLKLLFLCTGNSCRSQMAEAWARERFGERVEVASAGVAPTSLDPLAVRVMAEVGIDLSGQTPKHLRALVDYHPDLVITVCDHAREHCPVFSGAARVLHRGFDDPPALAAEEEDAVSVYRRVRDEIRSFVESLSDNLELQKGLEQ